LLGAGNLFGESDIIDGGETRTTTVDCASLEGVLGRIKREDFMRLENQPHAWHEVKERSDARSLMMEQRQK